MLHFPGCFKPPLFAFRGSLSIEALSPARACNRRKKPRLVSSTEQKAHPNGTSDDEEEHDEAVDDEDEKYEEEEEDDNKDDEKSNSDPFRMISIRVDASNVGSTWKSQSLYW